MDKKYKILIVIASLVYVVYHFATLIYSPLPWFDEVSFGSVTNSYLLHHTFYEDIRIIILPNQKLDYGPVYFIIQAAVLKTLGFGIFNSRLMGMLFGFADIFLVYRICLQLKFSIKAAVATILLIALEPNFNQFLHSGRNDFVTLFFFFLSYLLFIKIKNDINPANILRALLTGVLLSCSFLTTPRIIFAFSFYVAYLIYEAAEKDRNWKGLITKYAAVFIGFISLYAVWVYKAYGSVANFIYYYTHSELIKEHTGIGSGLSIKYNMLVYIYSFCCFFILVKNKAVKKNINFVLLTLPVIISFLVLVTGGISGRYFAMVSVFTAILITGVSVSLYDGKALKSITYLMIGLFGVIFVFKGVYILSTLQQHDPYYNEKVISKYISKNALVVGEFRYYYIARDNDCSFLSLEENGAWDKKMKYFLEHKANYFIINKDNANREAYEKELLNNHYQLEAVVDDDDNSGFFHKILMKLPYKISENYSCYIYKYTGG